MIRIALIVFAAIAITNALRAEEPPRGGPAVVTYVLTLWVCLIASPTECRRQDVPLDGCSAGGIAQVSQWAMLNPEYRVEKWWPCKAGQEPA